MATPPVGTAFSILCELGYAVGLATHYVPRQGHLIWIAEHVFEDEPSLPEAESLAAWRWPVFFPLNAALRRHLAVPLGRIEIPQDLRPFPRMRGGDRRSGWKDVEYSDGGWRIIGPSTDPDVPLRSLVNDTRLREKIVSDWRPRDTW